MVQDSQMLSRERLSHLCRMRQGCKGMQLHNNFVGKIFAFLFNSDRAACIRYIRENGEDAFAKKMAKDNQMTIRRR